MIQLYSPTNTEYSHNGDITLTPSSATVHAILNGAWTTELTHPIDPGGRWKYIVDNAVIKMPSFNGDQLFRIRQREKSDSGITVQMEPIFMDAMDDCFLTDVRPTGKTGQEALDILTAENSKYSGSSNITKAATAYYQYVNLIEAINGDISQSFVKRWGGEILYNNYQIIINDRVGGDYGVELRYGKNIPADGLTESVDFSGVVTRIYPTAYNGRKISNNGYVDSPNIGKYPTVFARTIKYENIKLAEDLEGDPQDGDIVCSSQQELDEKLIEACNAEYEAGIDSPSITINADIVLLQNTIQYRDYAILETVSLGDTIHCRHSKLQITTDARVIELTYDCLRKKVTDVTLGDYEYNYFDDVTSGIDSITKVVRPDGTVMADRVQGILNGIYTQLKLQSSVAQKVEGRAFTVEDLDPDSPLYGCMTWGTQGIQISTRRTADGRDWDWTTAITANGIVANAIITGLLSDKTGRNYWNLDTGEFRLSSDAFQVDDENIKDYIDGQIEQNGSPLVLQLTNAYQGIATDAEGNNGDYTDAYTDARAFFGQTEVTGSSRVTWTVAPSETVEGTWDEEIHRYTVTNLTENDGYVDISATFSDLTVTQRFSLSKVRAGAPGRDGEDGTAGPPGKDGKTSYFHVKYSQNPDGNPMTETPSTYIGTYVDFTEADSTDPADYTWARFEGMQGEQGIPGTNGEDGKTSYLHIKYSDDGGLTFTGNNGEDPGAWLGQRVDLVKEDSSDPADYKWSKTQGEPGVPGRVYTLSASNAVITQDTTGNYIPSSVTYSLTYRDGTGEPQPYAGRFRIYESMNGSSYMETYISEQDETSVSYTPKSQNAVNIRVEAYMSGGVTEMIDYSGTAVVKDAGDLTQEEIFNILTNNGQLQGIYMQNGQLYINASYIMTGILSANRIAAYSITSEKIEAGAITAGKIAANAITSGKIAAGAITSNKIAAGAITADMITSGTFSSNNEYRIKYNNGSYIVCIDSSVTPSSTSGVMSVGIVSGRAGYNPHINFEQSGVTIDFLANVFNFTRTSGTTRMEMDSSGNLFRITPPNDEYGGLEIHRQGYFRPQQDGGFSLGDSNGGRRFYDVYTQISRASAMVVNSTADIKDNIEKYKGTATYEILNTDVCEYTLNEPVAAKTRNAVGKNIGFVIGEGFQISPEIVFEDGKGVSMYDALALSYKAIQELHGRCAELEQQIIELKGGAL